MDIPDKYVLPCTTGGKCRQLDFQKHGISVPQIAEYGMNFIELEPGNFESRIKFRCCTGCYQPIDSPTAIWLNDQLGLELPSAESLIERMKRLKSKVNGSK